MRIIVETFSGELPARQPSSLPDGFATHAENTYLRSGGVDPVKDSPVAQTGYTDITTLFRFHDKLLGLEGAYSFVPSPVIRDVYDRLYYTDDDDSGAYVTVYGDVTSPGWDDRHYIGEAQNLLTRSAVNNIETMGQLEGSLRSSSTLTTFPSGHGGSRPYHIVYGLISGIYAPEALEPEGTKHGIVCLPKSDACPDGWGEPYLGFAPYGTCGGDGAITLFENGSLSQASKVDVEYGFGPPEGKLPHRVPLGVPYWRGTLGTVSWDDDEAYVYRNGETMATTPGFYCHGAALAWHDEGLWVIATDFVDDDWDVDARSASESKWVLDFYAKPYVEGGEFDDELYPDSLTGWRYLGSVDRADLQDLIDDEEWAGYSPITAGYDATFVHFSEDGLMGEFSAVGFWSAGAIGAEAEDDGSLTRHTAVFRIDIDLGGGSVSVSTSAPPVHAYDTSSNGGCSGPGTPLTRVINFDKHHEFGLPGGFRVGARKTGVTRRNGCGFVGDCDGDSESTLVAAAYISTRLGARVETPAISTSNSISGSMKDLLVRLHQFDARSGAALVSVWAEGSGPPASMCELNVLRGTLPTLSEFDAYLRPSGLASPSVQFYLLKGSATVLLESVSLTPNPDGETSAIAFAFMGSSANFVEAEDGSVIATWTYQNGDATVTRHVHWPTMASPLPFTGAYGVGARIENLGVI